MRNPTLGAATGPAAVNVELDYVLRQRRRALAAHDLTMSAAVTESWRRSLLHGLNPASTAPRRELVDAGADARVLESAARVIDKRLADLTRSSAVLSLTDAAGVILRQWDGERRLFGKLQDTDVRPGYLAAEGAIGTTSGITLITRLPEMVRGPEHFAEQYRDVTSSGMVILHPVSGQLVGSLHLTNHFRGTTPLALTWVVELVRQIERDLLQSASRFERLLMASFLREKRDVRHAVVAVNEQTIISNAAAARLLGSVDQTMLWALASRATSDSSWNEALVEISSGLTLHVECRAIRDESRTIGAILRLAQPVGARGAPSLDPAPRLPGLAGHSERWRALCRELAAVVATPLLLIGERGVGKMAVARAFCHDQRAAEMDTRDIAKEGAAAWLARLQDLGSASSAITCVIVREIDAVTTEDRPAVDRVLFDLARSARIVVTSSVDAGDGGDEHGGALRDRFPAVVAVPALRDRISDLPDLVAALTARWLESAGDRRKRVQWMGDALKALSRLEWAGNVASLERLVGRVLVAVATEYVGARDLPADLVVRASRRPLVGLERVEANAILQAIRDANGNRYRAAKSLGIARSTLYRKMCALGLDLESSTF